MRAVKLFVYKYLGTLECVWSSKTRHLRKIFEAITGTEFFDPRELIQNVIKTPSEHRPTKVNEISTLPKILQIRCYLLSALGLICDTFLATHINNVSGKRTRKASSERYRT